MNLIETFVGLPEAGLRPQRRPARKDHVSRGRKNGGTEREERPESLASVDQILDQLTTADCDKSP